MHALLNIVLTPKSIENLSDHEVNMTVALKELIEYLDNYLQASKISDYCPNGLQIEGSQIVKTIIGGVTASQALIDEAIDSKADALLVHHGFFWKGEPSQITGIKRNRIKALLEKNISLIAYHLPLDIHPEVGNNIQLAKLLNLELMGSLDPSARPSIGVSARLASPITAADFKYLVSQTLSRECMHIGDDSKMIHTIGLCTGAAQGMISQAVEQGLDAYLSGEISEPTVHIARESGVNYFAAGHHATERGGVLALGKHLQEKFAIHFEFKDIPNPV